MHEPVGSTYHVIDTIYGLHWICVPSAEVPTIKRFNVATGGVEDLKWNNVGRTTCSHKLKDRGLPTADNELSVQYIALSLTRLV
jgi:hypothetical protein